VLQPLRATVAVLGFEPVIQSLLEDLLEEEPELSIIRFAPQWVPGQAYSGPDPDVLLISYRPDWQQTLGQQFPQSAILGQAGWRATGTQNSNPSFEGGAGYQSLVRCVKEVASRR
jgi:hypothetical protein